MADAVAECRTAADQAAELTETGETGLLRLVEILCAATVPVSYTHLDVSKRQRISRNPMGKCVLWGYRHSTRN